jgi:hypothetical protein
MFYETHHQVHHGDNTTPVIADIYTCYNGATPNCDGGTITPPITQKYVLSSQNGGAQQGVSNFYDFSSHPAESLCPAMLPTISTQACSCRLPMRTFRIRLRCNTPNTTGSCV